MEPTTRFGTVPNSRLAPITGLEGGRCKTIARFGLLYFVSLSLTVLIFTSINRENVDKYQARWWWAFLVSLFLTCSTALTALVLTLYVENYAIREAPANKSANTPEGGTGFGGVGVGGGGGIKDMTASPPDPDTGYSSSFKTVLTINSAAPTATNEGVDEPDQDKRPASPVTVVDMRRNAPKGAHGNRTPKTPEADGRNKSGGKQKGKRRS